MKENSLLGDVRFTSLIACSAVGDTIIRFRFTDNIFADLIGLILACLLAVAGIVIAKPVVDFYKTKSFRYKPTVSALLMLACCLPLGWTALSVSSRTAKFVSDVMLDGGPVWLYFISFLALGLAASFMHKRVTLKLAVVLFPVIVIFIVLMFCFSAQFMDVKYIMPYKSLENGSILPSFSETIICLLSVFIPALTLGKNVKKRQLAFSFGGASAIIILCFLNTVLIFGTELAGILSYPYAYAVSTASLGHIFSRMDGFLYAVCFFTCFLKLASCLLSMVILVKSIFFQKNQLFY